MMLPPVILEVIFRNIEDPIVLTKLKLVSKLWNRILEGILVDHPKWKIICDDKVPSFWKNNDYHEKSNQLPIINNWRNIYTSWICFQKAIELPKHIDPLKANDLLKFSESERITCIAVQCKKQKKNKKTNFN